MFSLRDKDLVNQIMARIHDIQQQYTFMHVCGTHQDTLVKHGIEPLLEKSGIRIIQGPGCPVCVTSTREIEEMISLATEGKTVTSFGDMIQVPGESSSLQYMRTEGCDVRTVYSIQDAVGIAKKNPNKEVVFMAVGFETTAPSTAVTLMSKPPENFSILSCHRLIPPALLMIVEMGEVNLDGFIDPGHVSTIIGTKPYEFLSSDYHIPQVVAGFEPVDLVMAVWMLVKQNQDKIARVDNEYERAVQQNGNKKAQEAMNTVFDAINVSWRGFPVIASSGLELSNEFDDFNARKRYEDELTEVQEKEFTEPTGCRCGELLRGIISPSDCPLFRTKCTPDHPIGPCMVSVEGSCNIMFKYGVNDNK